MRFIVRIAALLMANVLLSSPSAAETESRRNANLWLDAYLKCAGDFINREHKEGYEPKFVALTAEKYCMELFIEFGKYVKLEAESEEEASITLSNVRRLSLEKFSIWVVEARIKDKRPPK